MKRFYFILLIVGIALPGFALGEVVQIDASLDTGFIDQLSDNNLGAHIHVTCGQANNLSVRRALFFMDIAAFIPAGSTINSVEFEFDVTNQGGFMGQQGADFELHRLTSAWTEGSGKSNLGSATGDGATWIKRTSSESWTTPGGDFAVPAGGSVFVDHVADGAGTITYSLGNAGLISDVQNMLDNAESNFGFLLKASNEGLLGSAIRITARENTDGLFGFEARLIIDFTASETNVIPDSYSVTRGDYVTGGLPELAESDNMDLSLRRSNGDLQSRTEFELKGVSPTAAPTSFQFMLEGSVFARGNVVQTIELFDYVSATWELVDTSNARRAPAPDSVVTATTTGDLSRFVETGTMCIEARIRYKSDANRQKFASNTDQAVWTIE